MSFDRKPKTINPDEVDPSVYYYDEVYEEMKDEERRSSKSSRDHTSKEKDRGSKYIQGLKETAELRKTEKELRKFKRYARDREEAEAEGELADKDVYITSAYRKKLKEIKKLEEEKRRRLQSEEGKSMNFLKKRSHAQEDEHRSKVMRDDQTPSTSRQAKTSEKHSDTQKEDDTSKLDDRTNKSTEKPKTKRPKTLEERREYLREVLAKRTVGRAYDEAVQRYIQRKALKQR